MTITCTQKQTAGCCVLSVVAYSRGESLNPTLTALSPDTQFFEGSGLCLLY